ncbi:uncharacterized protein LOC117123096 isoform X2 [Anneissia japonica]|uniref:uncharacterized protein LOC117123096 isoform X2 n=1 Tax=Anneissia japonica TaxID=1529436 RepID=UPI00142577C7|nr:uncharacterized protein LOC117123096 isoform X2 [Anneissia japonica]
MPGEKREKKLTKVVIVHFGTNNLKEVVKSLERAVDDHLHPEKISCRRKTTSIEKLIEGTVSVEGESIRGVCVISEELLELLRNSPKEKRSEFEDGLLKEFSKYPSFVCLKYKLQDEVVKLEEVLPGIAEDRILNLEQEDSKALCAQIYMQWFGSTAYVDDKGYHCVYEDEIDKTVNCVHIIHAGEDKKLLRGLSDALENVANPECSCEFRRRYREGDDVKQKILADVKMFIASLENEQNKCLIIVSNHLIERLRDTPEFDEIKKILIQDCFIDTGGVPNFVLLKMTNNDIFDDSTFLPIKRPYREELETIAEDALDIWFKPIRSPSESYYSSGEPQILEVRRQIQQSSHHSTGGPEGKLLPNSHTSLPGYSGKNPQEGEMVINEKSLVPLYESLISEVTTSCHGEPSQLKSHVTKSVTNGQEKPVYREEIKNIDQKGFQTPRAHIPSENPDDLSSNPPPLHGQPSNLSTAGNVVNASHNSFRMNDMPNKTNLSLHTAIRNSNHCNEDARTGHPSSLETGVTGDQRPNVTTPSGQPTSIGTHDQQAANSSISGGYVADPSIPGEQTVYRGTPETHAGHNRQEKGFLSLQYEPPANEKSEPDIKSMPIGTKPCIGGTGNGGNFSSIGPGKKSGTTYGNKNLPDANENSTESPDSNSGANGRNTVDKGLVIGLDQGCRKELIQRLDLPIPCVHDWRNLAGHYGVPNTTIHVWSGKMPHLSASEALLSWLGTFNPELKVETLKKDLGNFRRRDTLKILERHGY